MTLVNVETGELFDLSTTTLAEDEAVIERGLNTFVEVGQRLTAIRDHRKYRAEFSTFEDYCQERWGFTQQYATSLVRAAGVAETMVSAGLPAPANERQARELTRVPEPDRPDVWRQTVERTNGKPTASAVRETYAAVRPAPAPEPEVFDAELVEAEQQDHAIEQFMAAAPDVTRLRMQAAFSSATAALSGGLLPLDPEAAARSLDEDTAYRAGVLVRDTRDWLTRFERALRGLTVIPGGKQ